MPESVTNLRTFYFTWQGHWLYFRFNLASADLPAFASQVCPGMTLELRNPHPFADDGFPTPNWWSFTPIPGGQYLSQQCSVEPQKVASSASMPVFPCSETWVCSRYILVDATDPTTYEVYVEFTGD